MEGQSMSLPAYTSPKQLQQKPMTTIKHKWAWEQRTGSSAAKLVLLALARRANEHLLAFPSVKSLSDDTELNRKTVLNCLSKLIELQLIIDTGYRVGSTKQIVVYKLQIDDNLNNTNLGTVIPDNSPVFTVEQSQKRATEELFNNKEKDNIPPIVPPSGDVSGLSLASQSHSEPAKTTEPASKPAESKAAKRKPAEPTPAYVLDQFEHFWQSMPLRKVGKDLAQRAFVKTTTGKTEAEVSKGTSGLLADLAKRFKHIEGYDSSYRLLHPSTYLNQRRWTDEDMPERKGKLPASPEEKANKLIVPEDISDGGTQLQKWAVAHGFRAAKGTERGWNYLQAVKAWAAEKNGGAV